MDDGWLLVGEPPGAIGSLIEEGYTATAGPSDR
jgi:hypothetical protein